MKANPDTRAEGVVVESKMEQGRGSVATVLVQRGTLKVGDIFVAGAEWGRVRALTTPAAISSISPARRCPPKFSALNGTPMAGDDVVVVE